MNRVADWRFHVKKNKRKSMYVILSFILIYALVGLVLDWIYLKPHWMSTERYLLLVLSDPKFSFFVIAMMAVALVSLLVGRFFTRAMMMNGLEYHEVSAQSESKEEIALYNIVEEMKIAARLRAMPRIYIVDSNMMNAFATGWNDKNAAIAITRPLLNVLTREELQAVIAHEISHIRHQDIRLISSVMVMSSLLLFIIDVVFRSFIYQRAPHYGGRSRQNNAGGALLILIVLMVLRLVLPIITMALTMFLSRSREFMADAGCVQMTRQNEPLARALIKIHNAHVEHPQESQDAYRNCPNESLRSSSYLYDQRTAGIKNLLNINQWFSSHPSLKDRLIALNALHLLSSAKKSV